MTAAPTAARTQTLDDALDSVRAGAVAVARRLERAPAGAVPAFSYRTGGHSMEDAYDPDAWSRFQWVGFLAGRMWLAAEDAEPGERAELHAAAGRLARTVGEVLAARPPGFSAAGSDLFYAVCLGARATGDAELATLALAGTRRYAENFVPELQAFLQVPGVNRAVVDTGLNLLPFYWAAGHDPALRDYAEWHNQTLLRCGIIRDDGSVFQALEFHEGTDRVRRRWSMQGFSNDTTWARGQSWAMHNYTGAYEATGRVDFLDAARATSRWYLDHLPHDRVPFYDFGDPAAPAVPRDSCSAAISACALLRLADVDPPSASWARPGSEAIIDALVRDHLSPGGVLLHGSWGRLPPEKAGAGIGRFPLEDVMPYGHYWITEALYRSLRADRSLLALDENGRTS
ncbi:hypothetical protein ACLFMI_16690 [Pseudonocardia nantongensis]|uniref:hypothetical protein n=1 Tax=Pseudonocardia nantongensis TaxID=1181885 RepID=UPI00397B7B12